MESRKLQKVGYSTLSISLPNKWVKDMGLKRGDIVFLEREKKDILRISLKNFKSEMGFQEFLINYDKINSPKLLERLIVGCYLLGGDLISIFSSDKRISSEHVEEIRNISRRLIGMGIIEAESERIKLQCYVNASNFDLEMLLRRVSIITSTVIKEAMQALVEKDVSIAEVAIKREEEVDAMYFLASRLLMVAQNRKDTAEETGFVMPSDALYFSLILRHLEMVADYAEEIARSVIEIQRKYMDVLPKWVIDRINSLNNLAHDLVTKSIDSLFIADVKIANSLLEIMTFIESERNKLMAELPQIPNLRLILWNITRIADGGASIALITINRTIERKGDICSRRFVQSIK